MAVLKDIIICSNIQKKKIDYKYSPPSPSTLLKKKQDGTKPPCILKARQNTSINHIKLRRRQKQGLTSGLEQHLIVFHFSSLSPLLKQGHIISE